MGQRTSTSSWTRLPLSALALLSLLLLAATASRAGQAASDSRPPAYDVVTIRPVEFPGRPETDTTSNSYIAHNVTLKMMLEDAYGIRQPLISGIPRPLETARFDLQAKVVDPDAVRTLNDQQRQAMLLQVLNDRFHLRSHVEMKVLPVYDLVVRRGGPKFNPAPQQSLDNADMDVRRRMLTATAQPMPALANILTSVLNRSVLDKTGLSGAYDFTLRWTPDGTEASTDVMAPPGIFAALEDQLGLRLQSARGPVKTLIVDEAQIPSEN